MSQPCLLPANAWRNFLAITTIACSLLLSQVASASPTIQVYLGGDLNVPAGTVGVLVADRAGNGFHPLDHVTTIGTRLAVGEAIGLSDDLVVGVLQASDQGFAGPGLGFTGILRNLPYPPHQLSPGMSLIFYWFPGHQTPGERLANGDAFETFRTDSADAESGGDLVFALPDRRGVHTLSFVSPTNGGGVSMSAPGASGIHLSGQAGTSTAPPDGGGGPIDQPNRGNPETTFTDSGLLPGHSGHYVGLIAEPGSRFAGEIRAYLSPQGLGTIILFLDGRRHVVRGAFDATTGEFAEVVIPRTNAPDLTVSLQLATASTGGLAMTGALTTPNETRELLLNRTSTPEDANGSVEPGRYTLLLPTDPSVDPDIIPGGSGYGIVKVLPNGRILANLVLGDGTPVSDATFLDADGSWNLFQSVYGDGFVAGHLAFREVENISDIDGSVHWKKNPVARPGLFTRYPNGFELAVHAVGSRYQAPGLNERLLSQVPDGTDNASWRAGSSLLDPPPSVIPLTWQPNNLILPFNNGDERLQVLLQPTTGEIVTIHLQRVTDPNGRSVLRRVVTRGVALQKQGLIAGLTLFQGSTDHLSILPAGTPTLVVYDGGGAELANNGILEFGDIGLEGGVGERVVEISNTGSGNLLLPIAPAVEGTGFSLVADRAGYLAPGETSCLRIRWNPSAEGSTGGTLTIASNDREHHPFILQLTGNGLASSSQSNIEGGNDTLLNLRVDLTSTPSGTFDTAIHPGWYRGAIIAPEGGEIVVYINPGGAFSGTAKFGGRLGRVRGTVNPDGSLSIADFRGWLAQSHQLSDLTLGQLAEGGASAITGTLEAGDSGELIAFTLVKAVNRSDLDASHVGRFTMVLPAMEDLGIGYPSGDGIATLFINANGLVNIRLLLADRQRRAFSTRLDSSGADLGWSFHHRWALGEIAGRVVFAVSGAADFQGTAVWRRFDHPRQRLYAHGFNMETPILGSAYRTTPGERMLPIPTSESTMMTANLTGSFDPVVAAQFLQWNAGNVFSDDSADDGILRLTANRGNGWISGVYLKPYVDSEGQNRRQRILVDGVVFQKQNLVTGSAGDGISHGAFGLDVVE
ncbi:MAG: hypothetical protein KDN20_06325 [Verrucomicrobiae bacterium]|nr:hypothetical protein [Verrucomicrobiae bacterium]